MYFYSIYIFGEMVRVCEGGSLPLSKWVWTLGAFYPFPSGYGPSGYSTLFQVGMDPRGILPFSKWVWPLGLLYPVIALVINLLPRYGQVTAMILPMVLVSLFHIKHGLCDRTILYRCLKKGTYLARPLVDGTTIPVLRRRHRSCR